MANDNPELLDGFATDEASLVEAISTELASHGWSLTNSKINGKQLNTMFNQIFGYLNFLQKKGFSFWQEDKSYIATASYIDIVRRGNKIYFAKQDSNPDPKNNPLPKAPESNPDYWGLILDLDNPPALGNHNHNGIYALLTGSSSQNFNVKNGISQFHAINKSQLDNAIASLSSVGTVIASANSIVPSGYLECNGALLSRTTYANLFAVIGTTYGVGDGSTTFALPDLRGEFIRGFDNGRGVDSGRTIGSNQNDAFKSHTHNTAVGSAHTTGSGSHHTMLGLSTSYGKTSSATGDNETRPRNIAMMYCIKY